MSKKKPKLNYSVKSREPVIRENPDAFYNESPSWKFGKRDTSVWAIDNSLDGFMCEILPYLSNLENRTWADILLGAKKQNHSVSIESLNAIALKRLEELKLILPNDALVSLRLTGNHRLYGYIIGAVFYILWYDTDHGDNETCVCRTRKKHT